MKKPFLFFCFFILTISTLLPPRLNAAILHVILVGDTMDDTLGSAFASEVQRMHDLSIEISARTDLSLNELTLIEEDAKVDNVLEAIASLEVGPDDVVLVYFGIHGYRNPSKANDWPSLFFGVEGKGLDFHYVNSLILKKNPRFFLSMADSCNNYLPFDFPTVGNALAKTAAPYSKAFVDENYRKLFLEAKGSVIVSSSLPGEYSWAYPSIGGLWTLEFLKVFSNAVTTKTAPSWQEIVTTTDDNVVQTRIWQKGDIQHAQYKIQLAD